MHAFASFLLLSNSSILLVADHVSDTTSVHNFTGIFQKQVLYIDPTVEWVSKKSLPYVIITFVVEVFLSVIPSILLCIYPTKIYRYLSRFMSARKRLAITAFAEALHSCFKDGLNGTGDYRALAGATFFLVLFYGAVHKLLSFTKFGSVDIVTTVIWMILACVVSYVKPCKSPLANFSLSAHMALIWILMYILYLWKYDLSITTRKLEVTLVITFLLSHMLVIMWVIYTLIKCALTKLRYQLQSPVPLTDIANNVKLCFQRRYY